MPADIERIVIYDVLVPTPEASLMGDSRTIITAGDDGFLSIEQIDGTYMRGGDPEPPTKDHVGLTPQMITAIVNWATAPKYPR